MTSYIMVVLLTIARLSVYYKIFGLLCYNNIDGSILFNVGLFCT